MRFVFIPFHILFAVVSGRDQSVEDNEGMGRKSSKRCCIFHKVREFGESSTDSSDYDSDEGDESDTDGEGNGDGDMKQPAKGNRGPIARPKNGKKKKKKKIPDYQRHHA